MGSMVQDIGTSLGGLCEHVEKLNTNVEEQRNEIKTGLTALENRFVGMETRFEEMENRFENVENRFEGMESRLGEMENRFEGMENKFENRFEEMENRFEEMQKRFEKVENQLLNVEEARFRDGQHRAVHDMESARSDQATPAEPNSDFKYEKNPNEYLYVVAGGYGKKGKILNSAEIFDKTSHSWVQLQPMKTCRANASSLVYNSQVLVTGGNSGDSDLSSIEQFSRNANPFVPPCWSNLEVNLPRPLRGHYSVVYNDRLIVLGSNGDDKNHSYLVYEIQLHFPFTTKILANLPSSTPINGCGVVLVNEKILIFGGCAREILDPATSTNIICPGTANVTMYDITKNEFKKLAPLPYEVCNMATVKFGEHVVLAGGSNNFFLGNIKNTVVNYDIETQKSTMLPPMKQKRSECCAVLEGNSLVVMGGESQKNGLQGAPLTSVEEFDIRSSKWGNLPSMKEARKAFIAEIV
jgi:hypothetical protein